MKDGETETELESVGGETGVRRKRSEGTDRSAGLGQEKLVKLASPQSDVIHHLSPCVEPDQIYCQIRSTV